MIKGSSDNQYLNYNNCFRFCFYDLSNGNTVSDVKVLKPDGQADTIFNLIKGSKQFEFWFLNQMLPILWNFNKPWIFINGDTKSLDQINFSERELARIAKFGLHVFYFEPLFLCNQDLSWPWMQQSIFPQVPELDLLQKVSKKLIYESRVVAYICEDKLSEYFLRNDRFTDIEIKPFNTHLLYVLRQIVPSVQSPLIEGIGNRLLCLNFRYESVREILVAYIRGKGYHQKAMLSYYHLHQEHEFIRRLPFDPTKMQQWPTIKAGIELMQPELPFYVEANNPKAVRADAEPVPDMNMQSNFKVFNQHQWLKKSFINLICESRPFSPRGEISEKTIDAIQHGRPFILMAAPMTLQSLKELGFKTFSDIWDESYDHEEDHLKRCEKILTVIDYIFSLSEDNLKMICQQVQDRLDHNRTVLYTELAGKLLKRLNGPNPALPKTYNPLTEVYS